MTEEVYLKKKPELDAQYKLLDDKMDELGFSAYQDGTGDYGIRRYCKSGYGNGPPVIDGELVWEIMIIDMYEDYFGEYPETQFWGLTLKANEWVDLETVEDLTSFISKKENYRFKLKA